MSDKLEKHTTSAENLVPLSDPSGDDKVCEDGVGGGCGGNILLLLSKLHK